MTVAQASFALVEENKAHSVDADVRARRSMCGLRHDLLFKGVDEHEVAFYLVVENPTFAQLRFSQYTSVCASSLIQRALCYPDRPFFGSRSAKSSGPDRSMHFPARPLVASDSWPS